MQSKTDRFDTLDSYTLVSEPLQTCRRYFCPDGGKHIRTANSYTLLFFL